MEPAVKLVYSAPLPSWIGILTRQRRSKTDSSRFGQDCRSRNESLRYFLEQQPRLWTSSRDYERSQRKNDNSKGR